MCGISCIVQCVSNAHAQPNGEPHANGDDSTTSRDDIESKMQSSLDLIRHRGPDSRGIWISEDKAVALGHCRLAINDLRPAASQPLHSPDNSIHAVVNGEIYDFDRLRQDLAGDYPFHTHSDSEVVLALYRRHGHLGFLQHLRGEFAICIYDERKRRFIAVRDRYGIKPLFWTVWKGKLMIAAEVKAFLGFGWKAEWDVRSIVEGGWNFDDRTLFQGVRKLAPGHYLTCDMDGGGVEVGQYWDTSFPDKFHTELRTEAEMTEQARKAMLEAVRLRLRADVPVGVYLSGGIDSSALAGMASHLIKTENLRMGTNDASKRICCFSIAFDESSGFDESSIAERTAKWLDVEFVKVRMDEETLAKSFEDAAWHCEQPHSDLNFIGKFALSEVVRDRGYKVVLTGEGADEIFAGYPVYLPDFLREPDYSWSHDATMDEDERQWRCEEADEQLAQYYNVDGGDGANRWVKHDSATIANISTPSSMCAFKFDALAPWSTTLFPQASQTTIFNAHSAKVRRKIEKTWHPLHSALYVWSKGHLVNSFLTCLGDRTEMAHSVEARPAFLDHHLTELVNHMPPSMKIRHRPETDDFVEKWVQREAAKPFITEELYARKKHPYSAPAMYGRDGPMYRLVTRLCSEEKVRGLGFVDWERTKGLIGLAFDEGDARAFRTCLHIAQYVVLAERFGVGTAQPASQHVLG